MINKSLSRGWSSKLHLVDLAGSERIGDETVPFLGEGDVPTDQRVGAGGEGDEAMEAEERASGRGRRRCGTQRALGVPGY